MEESSSPEILNEWEQIMGDDICVKYSERGNGDVASVGTVVTANLTGYFASNPDVPFERLVNQRARIGDTDLIPGLELPLRHSRVGDIFLVRCASKFAYGPVGRPANESGGESVVAIPPDSDLQYEVVIIAHQGEEDLPPNSRDRVVFEVSLRKDCGNRWYSYSDYTRAGRAYSKGAEAADNYLKTAVQEQEQDGGDDDWTVRESALVELYSACLNNLAACYLHKNEYLKAKEVCIRVLELNPRNIKGLLRASKAALALHEHEEAAACIDRVLLLDPDNVQAKVEAGRLAAAKKTYKKSSREMAKRMTKQLFPQSTSSSSRNSDSSPPPPSSSNVTDGSSEGSGPSNNGTASESPTLAPAPIPAPSPAAAVASESTTTTAEPPARSYSVFLLLFASFFVVLVSAVIANFASPNV